MRNYDIIKEIFKITQSDKGKKYYEQCAEVQIKEIEYLIAKERPVITGPKLKQRDLEWETTNY